MDFLALDPNLASGPRRNGVQCLTCHRVKAVSENLKAINFAGGASLSLASNPQRVYGPWDDVVEMLPTPLDVFRQSLFCSACHEYERPAGPGRPAVPGQATYSEWVRWQARLPVDSPLKDTGTCQHCHMPRKASVGPLYACSGRYPRDPDFQPVRRHTFAGTNLGPGVPLPDGTYSMLEGAGALDLQAVQIAPDEVEVSVQLANLTAGHKLPTGIDVRNMLVLVEARDADGQLLTVVPEQSSLLPDWAGVGTGPEDDAGKAGKGYAKVLSSSRADFSNPATERVEFVEAECEVLDNRIEGLLSDTFSVVFRLPAPRSGRSREAGGADEASARGAGPIRLLARAVYRRIWADFPERYGLPPTDVLGNPLAQQEIARARLSFQPAASFTAPGGTADLDFTVDASGTAITGAPVVVDGAWAADGLQLSSVETASGVSGCTAPDGHVYSLDDGAGHRVLAPATAATHNECTGGVLRLDFSPPAGHVEMSVSTSVAGAGFELRALDEQGREVAIERAYDDPGVCQLHPVDQAFTVHLDHHGIAALEARGVVDSDADKAVRWSLSRLRYRFDSAHPLTTGPLATPTATPTPDPGAPTATPTQTPAPSQPVLAERPYDGLSVVHVSGVRPPGSRVEIRTTDDQGHLVVLGAGTADEDGLVTIRLIRPLHGGESITAVNLRTSEESLSAISVPSAISAIGLFLLGLVLLARIRRRGRPWTSSRPSTSSPC